MCSTGWETPAAGLTFRRRGPGPRLCRGWKISGEQVVAASALVTAVASICVSVWLGLETRRHNRLSVQPRLDITFNRMPPALIPASCADG